MRLILSLLVTAALASACTQSEIAGTQTIDPSSDAKPSSDAMPRAKPATPAIEVDRCVGAGWCWAHGAPLQALDGAGDAVFAVGPVGTVLEWTDSGWHKHAAFTRADLVDVWVSAADDVWVTSRDEQVWRYDGQTWSAVAAKGRSITGSARDDVWLDTQHYDGTRWRDLTPDLLLVFDVIAVGRNDAWVVGLPRQPEPIEPGRMVILHYDGKGWTQVGAPTGGQAFAGGLALVRDEVWAYTQLEAFRYDGLRWVAMGAIANGSWPPAEGPARDGIVLPAGSDFTVVPTDTQCFAAHRVGPDHVFCVNRAGAVFHFDGSTWARTAHDPFGATLAAADWGRFPPALWAGNARLAWGSGPTDVFRVRPEPTGEMFATPIDVLEHYDGETWSEVARGYFYDIAGTLDDVWFAGSRLLHYDGAAIAEVALPPDLSDASITAIHTFGPGSTWFVAQRYLASTSLLLHYDGAWSVEWMESSSGPEGIELADIAGPSDRDLWMIATRNPISKTQGTGLLYRREGETWRPVDLWPTWGLRQLAIDGDRIWLSNTEGVFELSAAAVSSAGANEAPPIDSAPVVEGGDLWLGPRDVWMTSAERAMYLPR